MPFSLADDLATALALAAEADLISLDRYRAADLDVSLKADRSHVTDADMRVERVIREHLAAARPDDPVLGEEFGGDGLGGTGAPGRQWIVDPIDGTSNFLRGVPVWGTLIALAVDGVPEVGVVSAPALGRRWWAATGHGAWLQVDGGEARAIRVSDVAALDDASLSYNSFQGWDAAGRLDQLTALNRAVWRTRAYGDLWGHMLVAEGVVDICGEFDLKPWDAAALAPIVREAGGRVTDLAGDDTVWNPSLFSSNGRIHDAVLELAGD